MDIWALLMRVRPDQIPEIRPYFEFTSWTISEFQPFEHISKWIGGRSRVLLCLDTTCSLNYLDLSQLSCEILIIKSMKYMRTMIIANPPKELRILALYGIHLYSSLPTIPTVIFLHEFKLLHQTRHYNSRPSHNDQIILKVAGDFYIIRPCRWITVFHSREIHEDPITVTITAPVYCINLNSIILNIHGTAEYCYLSVNHEGIVDVTGELIYLDGEFLENHPYEYLRAAVRKCTLGELELE